MKIETYQKLHQFDVELSKFHFHTSANRIFTQYTLDLLEEIFGYECSLMAFLNNKRQRTMAKNFVRHNVDIEFAQKVHMAFESGKKLMTFDADQRILSRTRGYTQLDAYRNSFEKHGYTDYLIQFVKYPPPKDAYYLSYFMLFSKDSVFDEEDAELARLLSETIRVEQDITFHKWDIINRNNMLFNLTNYYPIGILIVENMMQVTFANDIAKEYLNELGFTDPEYYSTFFADEVYPYYQYAMMSTGSCQPIRIKNFLFNVVASGNPGISLVSQQGLSAGDNLSDEHDKIDNISTCVYIIRDSMYHTKFSQEVLDYIGLTEREAEIAELIGTGFNNQEIADRLFISANTVKIHINNILNKAGVNNRVKFINKLNDIEVLLSQE